MRLLVDECVDERLRLLFPGYECQTARFAIWRDGRMEISSKPLKPQLSMYS